MPRKAMPNAEYMLYGTPEFKLKTGIYIPPRPKFWANYFLLGRVNLLRLRLWFRQVKLEIVLYPELEIDTVWYCNLYLAWKKISNYSTRNNWWMHILHIALKWSIHTYGWNDTHRPRYTTATLMIWIKTKCALRTPCYNITYHIFADVYIDFHVGLSPNFEVFFCWGMVPRPDDSELLGESFCPTIPCSNLTFLIWGCYCNTASVSFHSDWDSS